MEILCEDSGVNNKKDKLKTKKKMIQELSNTEIIEINGGHNGTAYEAGQACRQALENTLLIMACVAFFFAPKS